MWGELSGHPHIYDDDARADVPRQHVDGRAAVQEVIDHLGCYGARISAHTLCRDAVVACHYDYRFACDARPCAAGDACQLDRERLQSSKAAPRLREPVLSCPRLLHRLAVERADGLDDLL